MTKWERGRGVAGFREITSGLGDAIPTLGGKPAATRAPGQRLARRWRWQGPWLSQADCESTVDGRDCAPSGGGAHTTFPPPPYRGELKAHFGPGCTDVRLEKGGGGTKINEISKTKRPEKPAVKVSERTSFCCCCKG